MRVPQVGEEMAHRAGDKITIALEFGQTLNSNPGRVVADEPLHAHRHLTDPLPDDAARGWIQGTVRAEHQRTAVDELTVGGAHARSAGVGRVAVGRVRALKTDPELIQQPKLPIRG